MFNLTFAICKMFPISLFYIQHRTYILYAMNFIFWVSYSIVYPSKFCLIKARKMICGRRIVQGPVQTSHNSRFLRKYWIKLQNLHGFLNQHPNNLIHINIGSCQILTDPCAHAPRHTTLC